MITEKMFVDSSHVARIKYYELGKILEVQFLNGSVYHYREFPVDQWLAALEAESIGKFIDREVKGRYGYEKQ